MGNETEEHARAYGVTFGPLKRALREHQYPVSVGELVEQYGGFELETAAGSERLESALQRSEESTFAEPWEVRDAILDGLDDEAVVGYRSDAGDEGGRDRDGGNETVDAAGDWSQLSEAEN
ncbi:DUF5789 family protein [Halorubrum trueperi]|uniref:DUF2795 domain-containing protein n=1 Tax=Halorubrum trueperi TaxID=2004704 RepID=A0ABD5UIA8_9EURY